MKRLPKKEEMKTSSIKRFFRIIFVVLILFVIGTLSLLFTNYKGYGDWIKELVSTSPPMENELIPTDTTAIPEKVEKLDSSLFKFKTHYEELDTMPWALEDSISGGDPDTVVQIANNTEEYEVEPPVASLSEPVIADSVNVKSLPLYDETIQNQKQFETPGVDENGTDRIIAIVGKNFLLNKNRDDQENILLILAEAKSIKSVSLSNKEGKIIFSSDQKNIGKSLLSNFSADLSKESITCDDSTLRCVIPIYYTFGKLGYAFVIKENEQAD